MRVLCRSSVFPPSSWTSRFRTWWAAVMWSSPFGWRDWSSHISSLAATSRSCFQDSFTEWSNPELSCSSLCLGKLYSQVPKWEERSTKLLKTYTPSSKAFGRQRRPCTSSFIVPTILFLRFFFFFFKLHIKASALCWPLHVDLCKRCATMKWFPHLYFLSLQYFKLS